MKSKISWMCFLSLFISATVLAQNSYYYSRHVSLPPQHLTAKKIDLQYPLNMENVKAIGIGNTQVAIGKNFNAMMYNPAFLGRIQNRFEIFGLQASLPPDTYDAAFFLKDHIDEFKEAISLNQVWEGVNAFYAPGATLEQKVNALNQIQDGMQFTMDLVSEVIGSAENPKKHGLSLVPAVSLQYGNWGLSLYGFGHSGFVVQQSPTLEALLEVDIPTNLDNPIEAAKAVAQMMGVLATVVLGNETFANEVFPVAFYLSYIDIVGALGYGFQVNDKVFLGANLKVVNRRFTTDRIAVVDYNQILSDAWQRLKSNVTGLTVDIGGLYQSPLGTSIGVSLQNIIPMQTISKSIYTEFRFPRVYYDRDENGKIITNVLGDTALVSSYRHITVTRPFDLKTPFIANFGISQSITNNWDIALDWIDIAEQDSRFKKSTQRIRLGTEYRYNMLKNNLMFSLRGGMANEKFCFGLGLNFSRYFQIDGAYAYDQFVKSYSYFTQVKIGW